MLFYRRMAVSFFILPVLFLNRPEKQTPDPFSFERDKKIEPQISLLLRNAGRIIRVGVAIYEPAACKNGKVEYID